MPVYQPIEERFVKYVNETDSCWLWIGHVDSCGYGRIRLPYHGPMFSAARWFWQYIIGPIPNNKVLCHTCDTPPCVKLDHLYVGTQKTNARDREDRGRGGGLGGRRRCLTSEEQIAIKKKHTQGIIIQDIADEYKVSKRTIYRYIKGEIGE